MSTAILLFFQKIIFLLVHWFDCNMHMVIYISKLIEHTKFNNYENWYNWNNTALKNTSNTRKKNYNGHIIKWSKWYKNLLIGCFKFSYIKYVYWINTSVGLLWYFVILSYLLIKSLRQVEYFYQILMDQK